ncbi:hypothetical protein [Lysinibacillus sphaericus]|uniref:hypothetical protein n=1 Tax=Lysinibacillus sphaericus TaxID=1421 RepID=UPI0021034D12|nr:hypothetical protein [Lysinibacillus sp. SDF0037]
MEISAYKSPKTPCTQGIFDLIRLELDGDLFDELMSKDFGEKMNHLETFAHNTNRPYKSLAYFGITLIPPSSHKQFLNMVSEANDEYKSEELEELMKKIAEAIKEDSCLIHYGV